MTTDRVSPECRLNEHAWCKGPGEVRTCYGELVFTIRCACPCHRPSQATSKAAL